MDKLSDKNDMLQRAIELDKKGSKELALDLMLKEIDELCWASHANGSWTALDRVLETAPVDEMSLTLMITLLSSTLVARKNLPARLKLFQRIKENMSRTRQPEYVERLLFGLEGN